MRLIKLIMWNYHYATVSFMNHFRNDKTQQTNLIGPNLTNQRAAIGKNSKHISLISEYCNLVGQDLLAGL